MIQKLDNIFNKSPLIIAAFVVLLATITRTPIVHAKPAAPAKIAPITYEGIKYTLDDDKNSEKFTMSVRAERLSDGGISWKSNVGLPTLAQNTSDSCERAKSGVTVDLVECSLKRLKDADTELNRVYQQLLSRLKTDGRRLEGLRSAQQAWIKFRDADCRFESEQDGSGSLSTVIYNECLIRLTASRAKDLQKQ